MIVQLDLQSRQPIYEQLVYRLSESVSLGVLRADEQLPSVRTLARDLGVNPNTVQKAYQELERTGIIYSVAGKGSFVAPGDSAAQILQKNSILRVTDAVKEGKRAGLTRTQVDQAVDSVYREGTTE